MAHCTGSPASRKLTKLTPLTTRPSFTSRQGMMRTFSIASAPHPCPGGEHEQRAPAGGLAGHGGRLAQGLRLKQQIERVGEACIAPALQLRLERCGAHE